MDTTLSTAIRTRRPRLAAALAAVLVAASSYAALSAAQAPRAAAGPVGLSISSITPTTGTSAGGTTVRINGVLLSSVTGVKFGSTTASFTYVAPPPPQRPAGKPAPRISPPSGYLNATAPAGTPGAAVHITVTDGTTTSSTSSADLFTYDALAPAAPTITSASSADGGVAVAWTDGATNGSSIISHTLRAYDGASLAATKTNCSGSPCTISGLTNGTSYTVTVTATNGVGASPASTASSAVTPAAVPAAPTITSASSADGGVAVAWTDGATNGSSIISHTLRAYDGASLAATKTNCSGSPCTISGLTNGTSYTVTVTATNGVGASPASTASSAVTPAGAPGAPSSVVATGGDASASVAFAAPSSNGSAITGYTVTASDVTTPANGGQTGTGSSSPISVTGLTNGDSYTFTVTATNGVGTGSASTASGAVTPAAVPGAPTNVTATVEDGQSMVSWIPGPAHGSAITSYTASVVGDPTLHCTYTVATPETDECRITGLANGDSYTFQVVATNGAGSGPAGSSSAVTPVGAPGAPSSVVATGGDASASVAFAAPSSNGSAITGYTVTASDVTTPANGGQTGTGSSSPISVTGLTNGDSYTFTVTATNGVGTGSASTASGAVTPVGEGWVLIAGIWFAPGSDHQSTDFSNADLSSAVFPAVDLSGSTFANANLDGTDLSATTLTGSSGCGITGAPTLPSGWLIAGGCLAQLPGAPASASATSEHLQSTVSWTPPTTDGGLPITSYVVTATGNPSLTCTYVVPASPAPETDQCLITGLIDGTGITFDVVAHTAAGDGLATTTATVIPASHLKGHAVYPGADLHGADLSGADLSGLNLSGINFTGADLSDTDLRMTTLYLTNFTSATMTGANLWGLDLQNVTLTNDGQGGANLSGADLTGCNLTSVDLTSVNFTGAKLGNAVFGHIDDDESDEAAESQVNFTDAYLVGATFGFDHTPADITGWTFAGADLTGVNLASANLSGASLAGANLTDTNLSSAVLVGSTLTGATVEGTNLGSATLTDLVSSGLTGVPAALPSGWYLIDAGIHPATAPTSPQTVSGTPGIGTIDVSWTPPTSDGGAPVTSYRASVVGDDTLSCTYDVPVGVEQDQCTISGLADVTTYEIAVVAINSVGLTSDAATSSPITTLSPAPVFTSPSSTVVVLGQRASFTVAADRASSFGLVGTLPRGLRLHDNGDGTATIAGRPDRDQATGTTTVQITATGIGTTTQDLYLVVAKRAKVVVDRGVWAGWKRHRLQFAVGSTLGIKVRLDAGGYVAPIHVAGLPAWATFDDNGDGTGTVTGSPGAGDVASSTVTFSVDGLPGTTVKTLTVKPSGSGTPPTSSTTTTLP